MIAEIQDFKSTELKKKTVVQENNYEHTILLVAVRFWFWLKEISRLEFQVNRAANKDFGSS
jgi:hypothetical protein